ncbi:uncharacterized protein DS421_17g598770 [Arachis hypogaea]|nr:uncharacterized protein DS421_17g598770 [Arachis hypogaea]
MPLTFDGNTDGDRGDDGERQHGGELLQASNREATEDGNRGKEDTELQERAWARHSWKEEATEAPTAQMAAALRQIRCRDQGEPRVWVCFRVQKVTVIHKKGGCIGEGGETVSE